jgi:hypothetical protein
MYMAMDAWGAPWAVFFCTIVFVGNFFVLNLVLAVLEHSFTLSRDRDFARQLKTQLRATTAAAADAAEAATRELFDSPFGSCQWASGSGSAQDGSRPAMDVSTDQRPLPLWLGHFDEGTPPNDLASSVGRGSIDVGTLSTADVQPLGRRGLAIALHARRKFTQSLDIGGSGSGSGGDADSDGACNARTLTRLWISDPPSGLGSRAGSSDARVPFQEMGRSSSAAKGGRKRASSGGNSSALDSYFDGDGSERSSKADGKKRTRRQLLAQKAKAQRRAREQLRRRQAKRAGSFSRQSTFVVWFDRTAAAVLWRARAVAAKLGSAPAAPWRVNLNRNVVSTVS